LLEHDLEYVADAAENFLYKTSLSLFFSFNLLAAPAGPYNLFA